MKKFVLLKDILTFAPAKQKAMPLNLGVVGSNPTRGSLKKEVFLNVQKHFLFYRTVQFEINPTNLLRVIHSLLT